MDLERVGLPLLVLGGVGAATRRWWLPRAAQWWWRHGQRRRGDKQRVGSRDLDV